MALITCTDAAFAYDEVVISGLNFEVNSGDYVCVVGENGSGKSTLIKGLLKLKTPHKGKVIMGEGLKANEIGYLPQQTAPQKDFPASAFEVVLSGRLSKRGLKPFYSKADKETARENMDMLDILKLKNKCYRELSGGQQQRVLLARALCAAKKILLLDEPVAGLDPVATQDLYKQIKRLNSEQGITIIMVSHDICSAVNYADKILHLNSLQTFFGTAAEYAASNAGREFLRGFLKKDGNT